MADKGQSLKARAIRKLASKSVDTKAGRKTIEAFLGPEGNEILAAIVTAVTKHESPGKAKEIKKLLLRFALKTKGRIDDGSLTDDAAQAFSDPAVGLGLQFVYQVQQSEKLRARFPDALVPASDRPDLQPLVKAAADASIVIKDIMSGVLQSKNVERLDYLIRYLGDEAFLSNLLYDPSLADCVSVVYKNLALIMEPWLESKRLSLPCHMASCRRLVAACAGGYSQFCRFHHEKRMHKDMTSPKFSDWFSDPDRLQHLAKFFADSAPDQHAMLFLHAVVDFRQLESSKIIRSRAKMMYRKFLREGANKFVDVGAELQREISDVIFADHARAQVFSPAFDVVKERLGKIFEGQFVDSPLWKEYWARQQLVDTGADDESLMESPSSPREGRSLVRHGDATIAINFSRMRTASVARMDLSEATLELEEGDLDSDDDPASPPADTTVTG